MAPHGSMAGSLTSEYNSLLALAFAALIQGDRIQDHMNNNDAHHEAFIYLVINSEYPFAMLPWPRLRPCTSTIGSCIRSDLDDRSV